MAVAVVLAAGLGTRAKGKVPKQFIEIREKPLFVHTVEALSKSKIVESICIVCHPEWINQMEKFIVQYKLEKVNKIVPGGKTGPESISNGVAAIDKPNDDCVIVHSGNRPVIDEKILEDAYSVYKKYGNATPAIPCVEVLFHSNNKLEADSFVDRDTIKRTQTPALFRYDEIVDAYKKAIEKNMLALVTDTTELFYKLGKPVYFSEGSRFNVKITFPEDLTLFEMLLDKQK